MPWITAPSARSLPAPAAASASPIGCGRVGASELGDERDEVVDPLLERGGALMFEPERGGGVEELGSDVVELLARLGRRPLGCDRRAGVGRDGQDGADAGSLGPVGRG
jgi:hypothetical protein